MPADKIENVHACEVFGHSMEPTLRTGDVVIYRPVRPTDLAPGDVILFSGSYGPVVHRFVASARGGRRTWLLHRGDNSSMPGLLAPEHLRGRITSFARGTATHPVTRRVPPAALGGLAALWVLGFRFAAWCDRTLGAVDAVPRPWRERGYRWLAKAACR